MQKPINLFYYLEKKEKEERKVWMMLPEVCTLVYFQKLVECLQGTAG